MTVLLSLAGYATVSAVLYALLRIKCRRDPVFRAPRRRWAFYLLSFTWGAPAVLSGAAAALFVRIGGRKPVKFGWGWSFDIPGVGWGLSLGLFFIAPEGDERIRMHEYGHAIQNVYLGPFMPAVILIPSYVRFWFRAIREKRGRPPTADYESVWFEGSATRSGEEFAKRAVPPDEGRKSATQKPGVASKNP